jgi:hypothetical protein
MIKTQDFLGTPNTNPFKFRHYDLSNVVMYVNGIQVPDEGSCLNTGHEKTTAMAYRTLFEGFGNHHANSGLQITHDIYISGYFLFLFDLTPGRSASEDRASPSQSGHIRIELKVDKPLTNSITCLLYLEYEGTVLMDKSRTVTIDF